ncbi:cytochrome aa3 quinol oxidase subunit IV [Sporolactobacillus laevolacticus]|jgi:cytochrome aa3-600 menaquinol oxidase subunit 4|uniref:cytochrome aa3 quinol oxidase subunit IV n=1 Tax=Sporolactobacillus laevolacticus TaxID=33018 RepID=UPI0025B2A25E|nr:cytochrome aa3 quinol oxidase subunit IV [Sporolactobacillus laevolacticus]MDF2910775.1 qoxD [Sporolactobacillus laevolacticus]MDN3955157.1 cytochrome aa3 quinol oxidase subunit IV [Sporolactobacillus laevolacticus]
MSENQSQMTKQEHAGFPWKQVIGLFLSLALTVLALWIAVGLSLPVHVTLTIIVGLAIFQAFIQLFMFMHVTEGTEPVHQIIGIIFGIYVAFAVVAGTLWILAYTI